MEQTVVVDPSVLEEVQTLRRLVASMREEIDALSKRIDQDQFRMIDDGK